ncbi:internal virion protein [Dickeya phage Katbat]|uniref:Internal virion protein B n=3 Tax=Aarhusvirus TaxID=2732675 RepID=A0A346NSW3_9CAUD|nr:internal virion protein [Dickeya phage Dagda]YP_009811908.1 internal virion protein [Dickeya phage Katbat]AXR70227.1 internal virion protein B [Dickeya phage Dagda]AXY81645.1 internal virion protein B [Dickeya phage Dagda_B1]AXY81757.1 internal virion protein B [Dickeya phage Katbat]
MCWMVAIPIAMAAAQQVMGNQQKQEAIAGQIDQIRRQKIQMITKMNYDDKDLQLQERQSYQDTVNQLSQNSMQNVRNMGTVRAAMGETMLSGNSFDRIQRVTQGDFIRSQMGLNENYEKDYAKIMGERVSNYENTANQVAAMKEPKLKGKLETIVDPLGLGIGNLMKVTDVVGKKTWAKGVSKAIDKDNAKTNK